MELQCRYHGVPFDLVWSRGVTLGCVVNWSRIWFVDGKGRIVNDRVRLLLSVWDRDSNWNCRELWSAWLTYTGLGLGVGHKQESAESFFLKNGFDWEKLVGNFMVFRIVVFRPTRISLEIRMCVFFEYISEEFEKVSYRRLLL